MTTELLFFNVWLEYIGADKKKKRKLVFRVNDFNEAAIKLISNEYLKEYLFMPKCVVILEDSFGNDLRTKPLFKNDKFFLLPEK